ncbi:hypothetical protein BIW11_04050 [Tropilaelaps mercedesae]|uniref:Uncharacterized protein n=1 Tax=Tropilaelaps mercedesae TaxID=418985 RepID=A0A1V9XCD3_9ACAR|nr:hypothetical protein BIW11_04050 [Tropilaelaps mercedesae]
MSENVEVVLWILCSAFGLATVGLVFAYHIVSVRVMKCPPVGRVFVSDYFLLWFCYLVVDIQET